MEMPPAAHASTEETSGFHLSHWPTLSVKNSLHTAAGAAIPLPRRPWWDRLVFGDRWQRTIGTIGIVEESSISKKLPRRQFGVLIPTLVGVSYLLYIRRSRCPKKMTWVENLSKGWEGVPLSLIDVFRCGTMWLEIGGSCHGVICCECEWRQNLVVWVWWHQNSSGFV